MTHDYKYKNMSEEDRNSLIPAIKRPEDNPNLVAVCKSVLGIRDGEETKQNKTNMKTNYFTFGQDHVHSVGGFTYDKDVVVEITAEDPRQVMFDTFGRKWCWQHDKLEDVKLEYYPRGIKKLI